MKSWVTIFSLTAISNSEDKHKRIIQTEEKNQEGYNGE